MLCYSARSLASAEYWIHFGVRSDGVHTFGNNSSESELNRMKSAALWFITIYGCLVFIFTFGINSKSIPCMPVHSASEIYPKVFLRRTRHHGILQGHNDDGLSGRGLTTSLEEREDRSFNNITANPVCRYFIEWPIFPFSSCRTCADCSIVGHWYVSNAAVTLATVSAAIPVPFFWRYAPVRRIDTFSCCRYRCRDVQIMSFKLNIIRQFDSRTDSQALRAE